MKRRKWWFIGAAIAMVASCVFAWKASERPQFKFLDNAELMFITTGGAKPGEVNVCYDVKSDPTSVAATSRRELGTPTEDEEGRFHVWTISTDQHVSRVVLFEMHGNSRVKPHAIVSVFRKPTWMHRIRLAYDNWRLGRVRRSAVP